MSSTRRTVKKILPGSRDTFDQQFWPIMVALGVLCAISIGAVITILKGPWMWGSLLLLPAATALAFVALFHMDDSRLRRSLQFAIILSLAAHLAILLFASLVNIFENPFEAPRPEVAQRKTRSIEISNQKTNFIWQQVNEKAVPEPDVEVVRKKTQVDTTPQPIPVERVKQTEPELTPQIVKREQTQHSIPRLDKSLSQLRRSDSQQKPVSSTKTETEPTAITKANPKESKQRRTTEVTASEKADSLKRPKRPTDKAEKSISVSRPAPAPAPAKTKTAKVQPAAKRSERADAKTEPTELAKSTDRARASSSIAPTRNRRTKMVEQPAAAPATKVTADAKQRVEAKPSESSGKITRRPNRNAKTATSRVTPDVPRRSPADVAQSSSTKRQNRPTPPSISKPTSISKTPRRATTESRIVRSTKSVEMPSPDPRSESTAREIQSRTLSVSRSKSGVAGTGNLNNLQRSTGGIPSPAIQPSDSSSRRETQSPAFEKRMLTTSQKSTVRRSVAESIKPTSAFKAETAAAAKISGSNDPADTSLESSAARIDSASTEHRSEMAAEKGEASVDVGATKIVSEESERRLSGGGAPEVAALNPERTRRSTADSDVAPKLASNNVGPVAAPYSPDSSEEAADMAEPSELARLSTRSGGQSQTTVERNQSANAGPSENRGADQLAEQFAQSAQRRERNTNEYTFDSDSDDEEDEEERRRRLAAAQRAQSPRISRNADPLDGLANNEAIEGAKSNDAENPLRSETSDGTESMLGTLTRKAVANIPGSAIGKTATNMIAKAATSLPMIEGTSQRRSESRANVEDAQSDTETEVERVTTSEAMPGTNKTAAELSSDVASEMVVDDAGKSNGMSEDVESANVEISRSNKTKSDDGFMLDIVAVDGPAGLSDEPDLTVGMSMRPASEESQQLQPSVENRYRNDEFGGKPSTNPAAVLAKEAFRQRSPEMVKSQSEPTTEAAIHLGLEFLARYQQPDGSWTLTEFDREHPLRTSQLDSDMAATGLAVLSFQGAGYNHREFKYARQINHAVQWLIANQAEDGMLYLDSDDRSNEACRLYSHGIAALALTEAYGMTQDPELREPAQRALDYIVKTQHPSKGGWRYYSEVQQQSSDTSVTGWMVMALQSGRLSELDVDPEAFEAIVGWLKIAADPENPSLYRYNPYAVNSQGVSRVSGRKASTSMTSVGLLMRIYTGWEKDDPRLVAGAEYLVETQLPSMKDNIVRDTYYWYYATQVLKHVDGKAWDKWNKRLRSILIRSQEKSGDMAGSWDPYGPVPDRWGKFGGRLYVTTMNLLSLEVRHRLLPLYIKTNDEEAPKPKKRKSRVIEGSFE
jgi:hypothetical protein